jgi:hypothetical protein
MKVERKYERGQKDFLNVIQDAHRDDINSKAGRPLILIVA